MYIHMVKYGIIFTSEFLKIMTSDIEVILIQQLKKKSAFIFLHWVELI